VETRLEATRSGEGDPSSKRTRASGDASSSGASVPSANEREVRDACTDALNVADEKVALAQAAYDLIDAHITKLDRDLRTFDQALLEREAAAAAAAGIKPSTPGTGGGAGVKPDGDTGGGGGGVTNGGVPAAESNEPRYCVCQRVSSFSYFRMGNWTDVVFNSYRFRLAP
jgi:inhibitor of growth protein 4